MEVYGVIYKITNLINQKCYIGQTRQIVEKRWEQHLKCKSELPLISALKKYGKENFKFEVICQCSSKEEMNEKEEYYIVFYNSLVTGSGYNIKLGGNAFEMSDLTKEKIRQKALGRRLNDVQRLESSIRARLNDKKNKKLTWDNVNFIRNNYNKISRNELANMFNVSIFAINKIIRNETWKDPSDDIKKLQLMKQSKCDENNLKTSYKLNWQKAYEIRENKDNLTVKELAQKYNVYNEAIYNIIHNRTWKIECSPEFYKEKYKTLKINIVKKPIKLTRTKEHAKKISLANSGEGSCKAKLTWKDICDIRINKNNLTIPQLAKLYNISTNTIILVMKYKIWTMEACPEEFKSIMPEKSNIVRKSIIGENNHISKLKWENIAEIRINEKKLTVMDFVRKFKVDHKVIRNIISCRSWKPENYPPHIKALIEEKQKAA